MDKIFYESWEKIKIMLIVGSISFGAKKIAIDIPILEATVKEQKTVAQKTYCEVLVIKKFLLKKSELIKIPSNCAGE